MSEVQYSSEDEEIRLLKRRSTASHSDSDVSDDNENFTSFWDNFSSAPSESVQDTNFAFTSKNDFHLKVSPKGGYVQKKQYKQRYGYFIILVSIVDVILLIAEIIYNRGFEKLSVNPWLGVSAQTLIDFGAKDSYLMWDGQVYRFATPMFLHVGIFHLAINLLGQLPIGMNMEKCIGTPRMVVLYVLSGIGGNILSAIFLPRTIQAGASSSLFGLLSVYLVDFVLNSKFYQSATKKTLWWIIGTIISLILGVLPGIDNFAHIGGSLAGLFVGMVVFPSTPMFRRSQPILLWKFSRVLGIFLSIGFFVGGIVTFYLYSDLKEHCDWCEYISCIPLWHWCDYKS